VNDPGFGQADLRFLLPLRPGQQVAILGHAPSLAAAVVEERIAPTLIVPRPEDGNAGYHCQQANAPTQPLPLAAASIDHILIPRLSPDQAAWVPDEVARVLKPGGWLFLGVSNAEALQRLRPGKLKAADRPGSALSGRSARRLLERSGLMLVTCYGVCDSLEQPDYLVPLEPAGVARHFFDRMYVPHSRPAALSQRLSAGLTALGLQRLLFKDLGLVAQAPARRENWPC
jgi:hypothetical protein